MSLTSTHGAKHPAFEVGKTYEEKRAQCASTGYHCVTNPLGSLNWYNLNSSRFFIVEAGGDIHEDEYATRISCTKLTLLKEITKEEFFLEGVKYICTHLKEVLADRIPLKGNGYEIVIGGNPFITEGPSRLCAIIRTEDGKVKEVATFYAKENVRYSIGGEHKIHAEHDSLQQF